MGGIPESILTGDQAVTTESFTELNSKLGAQWFIQERLTVPAMTTWRITIDYPISLPNRVLLKEWQLDASDQIIFRFYWRLTDWDSNDGTAIDIKNFHDSPDNSALATATLNSTQGTAPTEQQRAAELETGTTTNQNKQGIFRRADTEHVLTFDQQVLYEFQNDTNQPVNVNFALTWYEGPLSTDRKRKTAGGF